MRSPAPSPASPSSQPARRGLCPRPAFPASKYCENYWTVTFDGTAVYVTLARGPSDNCNDAAPEYSAQVNGTRVQPTRVNVSPEGVTFSAWTDPDFPGKVIVLWPYGWGKQ